jgi:CBS domain-containing protein
MPNVRELLRVKGNHVFSIGGGAKAMDGALLMNEHKIGALVVMDEGRVIGMFTERDVLQRVVAERRDPADTIVEEVMTREVVYCSPDTSLEEARSAMKNRRIRHLPVVEDEKLVGLISIGDLNAHQANSQEQTIHQLHEYLYGRV